MHRAAGRLRGRTKVRSSGRQTPASYKEAGTNGSTTGTSGSASDASLWRRAQPKDDAIRGKWWEAFNDPQLNELEEKAAAANQNIAAASANFLAARAIVREASIAILPDRRNQSEHHQCAAVAGTVRRLADGQRRGHGLDGNLVYAPFRCHLGARLVGACSQQCASADLRRTSERRRS